MRARPVNVAWDFHDVVRIEVLNRTPIQNIQNDLARLVRHQTGHHVKIALDVMSGLVSDQPREVVLNVLNRGSIEDLDTDDIVEVPCDVDRTGAHPRRTGRLPEAVRGL